MITRKTWTLELCLKCLLYLKGTQSDERWINLVIIFLSLNCTMNAKSKCWPFCIRAAEKLYSRKSFFYDTSSLFSFQTAGLLFSFEPPFEEHQGKRVRRYLVNCARRYRQMVESLLHEVTWSNLYHNAPNPTPEYYNFYAPNIKNFSCYLSVFHNFIL